MSERRCFVYFIQAGDGGPIKIGISRNVANRMVKMQTDTPAPLKVLGVVYGDQAKEAEYHAILAAHRTNGEWFAPHETVLALVAAEKEKAGNVEYLIPKKVWVPKCKLEAWRRQRNLTTRDIAETLKSTAATISRLECGKQVPSWPLMRAIFDMTAGEVTPNDFAPFLHKKAEAA